ncbi:MULTISPECIES: Asp-tRNA(Asn)/Glu-tRNA(Gln) amidotransferase subunit GatA [unclassified Spirosoma]|uniref:Asp-tRNA(Asn)/Glu-tRNA(Gln) amidotransferase subunit GatA n=1 Tax=unclassified Spirosoma TaxID=2621999 RepID=UPI000961F5B3|nr:MULTISPECIES: Asp-tRNA(Asn)/Glu-tRNA(Gln) amidotransferase subunit GatA [unclassified Spirosoma]MBN8826411.1 Asp-tRNA(Asn)/Glu-tRNA(Gln) amidotransferase subunit GatA [Spirosoma sp.]OJW75801.1 MAG: glutaminyl-tRNA synthase (glutamine-hydrolyzing) subunit A [Spirosoma sp. 48-14]
MTLYRSFSSVQADLKTGQITCRQLVEQYLTRIQEAQHLNVFTEVYADEARRQADLVDQKLADGTAGRLAGMVIGIKDVLSYTNHGVRAGSRILDNFTAQFTATAVQRLIDEDVIIIGRQNCDEFAMGSSNENSAFGPVRNAADTSRVPGGSSGGSAVAVQAGLCLASIGSDTGGSVRQPAAFCGVVGLKPTYGRVSRWGLIAYASSFDCIGPIANTPDDAALLLEIMAGPDEFDSTVSSRPVSAYSQASLPERPLRIAYLRDGVESEGVDQSIREATQRTIDQLKAAGHTVEPVEISLLQYLLPTYYILTTAEASSNLSRFDGVRYGYRSLSTGTSGMDLLTLYKKSRTEGFGAEVRRRILLGTFALSASYYDAYYTKAQQVRRLIRQETERLFEQYDFLLSPTTPTPAFQLGEKTEDPLQMYLADIFTVQANVVGYPAISIPNGTDANGLPIGIQLMAPPFAEESLIGLARKMMIKNG